ncbi:MarR family winged helix-turn-helix transcriptional regulator [Flavihumibacter sp. UBA7668]|uniref:MarR family winged helix-turn-helix transcriptional regulator n=1 Tax=Flavihumibacter sp. UBA7668 TaxID=1946542 RepID=UPI0025C01248|nr:MarR family transcriptional regulator [Flavihumibacter sp. UBA7668]
METDKVLHLRKLSQQYAFSALQMHEAIARNAGFSSTDHKYLGFFIKHGSMTAGELAALTGLTTGAITGLIDRFEALKLVKRTYDPRDRRKVIILPNSKRIQSLLEPFYRKFQEETEKLLKEFSENECIVLEKFFEKSIALMTKTFTTVNQ